MSNKYYSKLVITFIIKNTECVCFNISRNSPLNKIRKLEGLKAYFEKKLNSFCIDQFDLLYKRFGERSNSIVDGEYCTVVGCEGGAVNMCAKLGEGD